VVRLLCFALFGVILVTAQSQTSPGWQAVPEERAAQEGRVVVPAGTKILVNLLKGVNTKTAAIGDRVYLETAFPVVQDGRVIIPPGSHVNGTVTGVKRAGKVKGRSELYFRFDSLILPSGVTRDFRGRVGSLDGNSDETMDSAEGRVAGAGNKGGDAVKVAEAAGWGTAVGGIAARSATGAGVGAAAGAAAGLVGVLMTRGPDAILERGSSIEMILDRDLEYTEQELSRPAAGARTLVVPEPQQQRPVGWTGRTRP
jgi:type IV secretion system protein VirB10